MMLSRPRPRPSFTCPSLAPRGLVGALALLAALGCEARLSPGEGCVRTSECAEPYVCAGGRCRAECAGDRDCAQGTCEVFRSGGVCVPPSEPLPCAYASDCALGQACLGGTCRAECAEDRDCVLGTCVEGACTEPLLTAPAADAGVADAGCSVCGARCVDLAADPNHCGRCGNACALDEACLGGVCGTGGVCPDGSPGCCPVGQEICASAGCRDLSRDPLHCGACGLSCRGLPCISGRCLTPGDRCADAIELDLSTPSTRVSVTPQYDEPGSCASHHDAFVRFTLERRELVVAIAPASAGAAFAQLGIVVGGCGNTPTLCSMSACGHVGAVLDPGTYHIVLDDPYPGDRPLDLYHVPWEGEAFEVDLTELPSSVLAQLAADDPTGAGTCGAGPSALYWAARCETDEDAPLTISTCGSSVDTSLSVATVSGLLDECASADGCAGGGESLDVTLVPGLTLFTVTGATAADVGPIQLDVASR